MKGFRNRILAPLAIPVGATAVIVAVVFNYSRILLFLEKRDNAAVSTGVAVLVSAGVLFGSAYFSSRREARKAGVAVLGTAAIVLVFAGGYGSGASHAVEKGGGGGGEAGGGGEVTLGAHEFAFTPNAITLPPGVIKIDLRNDGRSLHTFQFETVAKFKKLEAPPGTTASGAVQLGPGTYTFFCSELGHRGSGMEGKLTVAKPGKG